MKRIISILSVAILMFVMVTASVSTFSAKKVRSPHATTSYPRQSGTDSSVPQDGGDGDDDNNGGSGVNDDNDRDDGSGTSGGDGSGANGGSSTVGDSTSSPVTGDFIMYSILIALGFGVSSLYAYKKVSSKK